MFEPMSAEAPRAQAPPSAKGLRVAIISDAAPERNGVGAYYRDLAEHLRAAGAQVELIAPRFRRGTWHGGLALPMPGDSTQKVLLPPLSLISKRLQRLAPDAIIVPTPGPYGMIGMHLARRNQANVVVGFHTHFERLTDLFGNWKLRAKVAQAYLTMCHKWLFRESDLVLANSEEMINVAKAIGADKVGLMGTPIPLKFIATPPTPLSKGVKRVLFAGRLAPEKNLEAIVTAARQLPDLKFMVAGDGPLREWFSNEAAKLTNLDYIGWVRRDRILPLIDQVDALVLPSTVESFGTIAMEAMARARIVLVSSQCGILSWDRLSKGLYPIRDDETLTDTLERVAALDHAMLKKKAAIARAAAVELNDENLRHWLSILTNDDNNLLDAGQ